jgi:hypothetical protein
MPEDNSKKSTRRIVDLDEFLSSTNPELRHAQELMRKIDDEHKRQQKACKGLNVLFAGDKELADKLREGNNEIGYSEFFDLENNSLDDVCRHVQEHEYNAVVFCTEPYVVARFCNRFNLQEGFDLPIIIVSGASVGEITSIGKSNVYWLDPKTAGGFSAILQDKLIDLIESGREYVKRWEASVLVMTGNNEAYSALGKKFKLHSVDPTPEGYMEAKELLKEPKNKIGAVVIDGIELSQELLFDTVQNEYSNTARVYVGEEMPVKLKDYAYTPFPDHETAAKGLPRILEAYNPVQVIDLDKSETRVIEKDRIKHYRGGRASVIRRFEDEPKKSRTAGFDNP